MWQNSHSVAELTQLLHFVTPHQESWIKRYTIALACELLQIAYNVKVV